LTVGQIQKIIETCRTSLEPMIAGKKSFPSPTDNTWKVLDKNITLNLKDSSDKVIHSFSRILEIAQECIQENKPMYFSVVER
jgi:hypothetical protein